ncbi:hypothetical protein DRN79_02520 [Methanosarcinales archaeon]|nr:MAG: hypothetical protein DRN79_02520 [Methanosarcinales archaeon]
MPEKRADVVVIGAGPAGSTAARVIAKRGFIVMLVEKENNPGAASVCAGGIPMKTFRETGLSSDVIEKFIPEGAYYYPWGEQHLKLNHISVCRNLFDRKLAEKATEEGAELRSGMLVEDVRVKNDRVVISAREKIESELVVFADGPNTLAYRKFGIGFKPKADTTYVSVACEIEWRENSLNCFEFHYNHAISQWGYGWIFPKRNTVNVGVGCLYSKLSKNIIELLHYMLNKYPPTARKLSGRRMLWMGSALIPAAPAERIFGERMLVVGDAAGMVDPVSGGGIEHAINAGRLAGDVCVNALEEGDFSHSSLAVYQNLWRKTEDHAHIELNHSLSSMFLYLSKFDRNAYIKMAFAVNSGIIRNLMTMMRLFMMK